MVDRGTRPPITTIPVRFHLYWAGSDRDGSIAGYYWAVTETLATPAEGEIATPPLPGPKPQDYRFTTRSDSTFIFRVAEDVPDRKHAFFIYAVDNLGKPDPTPARFIFNAYDQFPPIPIFLEAKGVGTVYSLSPGGVVTPSILTVNITDIDRRDTLGTVPRDTVPSGATLYFRWTANLQVPGTVVTGWRYKLDEPEFVRVPASVTSAAYYTKVPPDTVPVLTGTKVFLLRAVDQAEGSSDSTRRFRLNFSPDTWFSGPDLNSPSLQTNARGDRFVAFSTGIPPGGIVGSLMSRDSVELMPALRPERRSFFEIWNDTLYARQEGDTVHMNSIVILHGGGFDKDSRYNVNVDDIFRLPPEPRPVLTPGPANGSPVGFRWAISVKLVPDGLLQPALSNVFPFFNPNSFYDYPRVGAYQPMFLSGKAYATLRAEDGDGDSDARIQDARQFVEQYEATGANPGNLRSKILVFYVDYPPYFITDSGTFFPHPTAVDTITGTPWNFRFDGHDIDPYDPGRTSPGGPAGSTILRRRVVIRGLTTTGDSLITEPIQTTGSPQVTIPADIIANLATGPALVTVELCDCLDCENVNGQGRCTVLNIPIYYQRVEPQKSTSSNDVNTGRPGLDPPTSRSE